MDKFETLVQNNPITIPVRKELRRDTMIAITEVKRIRKAQGMLAGLLVLTTLLLIVKWMNNDLLYLIQLIIFKFTFIKSHALLYWEALSESFPKQNLLVICTAVLLWFGWRRLETFLLHRRINNRQTFTMKMIRLTPRLLIINTLLIAIGIGFATYSYAQATEHKQLQLLKEYVNKSGRVEFETNMPAAQCNMTNNPNLTNLYEIKKNASLIPDDAKKVIEAACNQTEAQRFLITQFHIGNPENGVAGVDQGNISTHVRIAEKVIDKTASTLTLQDPGPYTSTSQIVTVNKDTKVYKDNKIVSINLLKKGDIVLSLEKTRYAETQFGHPAGNIISETILGISILPSDPDFNWYNLTLQNSVTQIQTCLGNPDDRCTFTGGVDFFPLTESEADSTVNPEFTQAPQGIQKEIAGKLLDIHPTFVKIKTNSGRIFTIQFGRDAVNEFNQKKAPFYKVKIGDTLLTTYFEPTNQHSTTLDANQIINAALMIEVINKFDPVSKY